MNFTDITCTKNPTNTFINTLHILPGSLFIIITSFLFDAVTNVIKQESLNTPRTDKKVVESQMYLDIMESKTNILRTSRHEK